MKNSVKIIIFIAVCVLCSSTVYGQSAKKPNLHGCLLRCCFCPAWRFICLQRLACKKIKERGLNKKAMPYTNYIRILSYIQHDSTSHAITFFYIFISLKFVQKNEVPACLVWDVLPHPISLSLVIMKFPFVCN